MKKLIYMSCLLVSVVLVASCGNKDGEDKKEESKEKGWSKTESDAYMNSCVSSAEGSIGAENAKNYCSCTMEKLMAKYNSAIEMSKLSETEKNDIINAVAQDCISELGIDIMGGGDDASYGDGATNWSEASYNAYMESCVNTAKSAMGDDRATEYCACTAGKLQEMYPDETKLGNLDQSVVQKVAAECLAE